MCVAEKKQLNEKIANAKLELNQIIRAQGTVLDICKEKDKQIDELESAISEAENYNNQNSNQKDDATCTHEVTSQPAAMAQPILNDALFKRFENCFTADQLLIIRKIGNSKPAICW